MSISLIVNGMAHNVDLEPAPPIAVGASRLAETYGYQIRLRHCPVPRLHRPYRRSSDAVMQRRSVGATS
jgi:hypothetical protein